MNQTSPTNNRGNKPPRSNNRHRPQARSISLFPSLGESISTNPSIVRSSHEDGSITLSSRDLSPDPRSYKKQNSNGSPAPVKETSPESPHDQRINTYIDIGPTKGLLFSILDKELISHNITIVSRPEEKATISVDYAELSLKYLLQTYFACTNSHYNWNDISDDIIINDSKDGKLNREKLRKEYHLLDKSLYDNEEQSHLKECINGKKDQFANKLFYDSLTYSSSPDDEIFFKRVYSTLDNLLTDSYIAEHYPSLPTDRSNKFVQLPSATQRLSSRSLSRGTRQSSRAQHHDSTTTSTALSQRNMSMESRVNAQLGQFQTQQNLMASQMASLMATMAAFVHESRSGKAAQDKEDV